MIVAPELLITSPHFSFSCFMNSPKSGPNTVPTSAPVTSKLFRMLGLDRARSMSAVTLDKISVGVFNGQGAHGAGLNLWDDGWQVVEKNGDVACDNIIHRRRSTPIRHMP